MKKEPLPIKTKNLLRRYGLRARKGLGQHFLIDEEVLDKIIAAAGLEKDDFVIEVGPGLGVLTAELAERAGRVIAIELDDKLAEILKQALSSFENVSVINEDILKVSVAALLKEESIGYKVVANLPYYITSPVLRHFLEADIQPQVMVVMVQKEVAEEITAKPGKMSLLSIGVQLYGQSEIVEHVPAYCFYPEPEVDSAVLKVVPYTEAPVEINDREGFFSLVRAGFSAARKQLPNSLAQGLSIPKADTLSLLEKAGIEPRRRAETLTIEEWAGLWRIYSKTEGE
ncbi:16S rRNA (adenine(1518)-N(6)/adenine(1519)-N(6))-dimethyltransferase RsmA [Chloroflexota bacterium]